MNYRPLDFISISFYLYFAGAAYLVQWQGRLWSLPQILTSDRQTGVPIAYGVMTIQIFLRVKQPR